MRRDYESRRVGVRRNPARHHRRDLVTYGDATLILSRLIEYRTAGSNVVSNRMPAGFPTF
jgi:hypothetical protein